MQSIQEPSLTCDQLRESLIAFYIASSSVAFVRNAHIKIESFKNLSLNLGETFRNNFKDSHAEEILGDFYDFSAIALTTIYEEMLYVSKRYESCIRDAFPDFILPVAANKYSGGGDPLSEESVKEIDVVKGSVAFILEKLPRWAQKILEAIMEMLKISRGAL